MNYIKIIKTEKEHAQALARLVFLMDQDLKKNSVEIDELEVLALLIEPYEKAHYQIESPDPIEAIKFRMDQQGLKKKDLIPYIGHASKVTEVLNGTRSLSICMIRKLSAGLGISAQVLIKDRKPIQKTVTTKPRESKAIRMTPLVSKPISKQRPIKKSSVSVESKRKAS